MDNINDSHVVESRCHLVPPMHKINIIYNPMSALCHGYVDASFDPMNMVAQLRAVETAQQFQETQADDHLGEPITSAGVKTHLSALFKPCDRVASVELSGTSEKSVQQIRPSVDLLHKSVKRRPKRLSALGVPLVCLAGAGYSLRALIAQGKPSFPMSLQETVTFSISSVPFLAFVFFVLAFSTAVLKVQASRRSVDSAVALDNQYKEKLEA